MTDLYYIPTAEHIAKLSGPWCGSYSGGKDSSSLITWIEWLRRTKQIVVEKPQLVQSDTMVEYPELQTLSREMMSVLRGCGWECAVVEPKIHQKLYNRILGIGNTPIHAGSRNMRWCTRSTKIDPMNKWRKSNSSGLTITGVRMGESEIRRDKLERRATKIIHLNQLRASKCSAGGECGLPAISDNTYGPILHWTTCHVWDWLYGSVPREITSIMKDTLAITRKLHDIYDVRVDRDVFDWADPVVTSARFGCIGCPAIASDREAPESSVKRHGSDSPLNEIYDVWFEARRRDNRCVKNADGKDGRGPIRMSVRKVLFERIMEIQRRAGVVLVTPEDEAFIRDCWARKVYPRGWSEADEDTVDNGVLFGVA